MNSSYYLRKYLKIKESLLCFKKNSLIFSLICLFWFLMRTGRKPSRFIYPCQKIAGAQVTSYLLYLFPLIGIRKWNPLFRHRMTIWSIFNMVFKILIIFTLIGFISIASDQLIRYKNIKMFNKHKGHGVIGLSTITSISKAMANSTIQFNHRVVSVHDTRATNWDYITGKHWNYINQNIVNNMVARGVMALTDKTDPISAWSHLIPYREGEAVAIKVNFNNSTSYDDNDNDHDAFPETVNAVIDGLLSIGVPVDQIWITDPSRVIPDRFRDKIKYDGVKYYSARHTGGRPNVYLTTYVEKNSTAASPIENPPTEVVRPAQVLVDAHHLINIPMLKGHAPGWVTFGLKNHFGSVMFKDHDRGDMHHYIYPNTADPNSNPLGDINNNPHIRDKTRLVLGDALFGHPIQNWGIPPQRWQIFNDDSPNMLFFSVDPIAVESVMLDYLNEEIVRMGKLPRNHDYLHYSANLGLGIHAHWNDFNRKTYDTIDYVEITIGNTGMSVDPSGPFSPSDFSIFQNYPNPFNSETEIKYYIPETCWISIKVYNSLGQSILTLVDELKKKGIHRIYWNGESEMHEKVGSGIYYYQMITEKDKITKKMLLLK